ncbi:MAG: substrate-binding domain-containing protein [Marinospirillum sp.]|uniref:substrate-binding domain-containing protein n=1 Tax=Marinospirillum sp. TaxID=2183934 RepID=UPI0019E839DB|nr:substrate-binding domain-containing protein [Marinospirillum sp.]MBE0508093.1 substrate-binding domain-containing protein [Marinospirillum sp.]
MSGSLQAADLRISGASTIYPILEQLAGDFQQQSSHNLLLSAGGSGRGISDVRSGASDMGMVSRSLRDEEKADLLYTTIGLDTLVFIVNQANPQQTINKAQLISLYMETTSWQQLNGYAWPVRLVSKEVGRSTLDLFEEFSGLKSPDRSGASGTLISRRATVIGSNLEALSLVGGQHGGVGYVSLGTAASVRDQGMPIRILQLDGITPSAQTIQSGQYPIRRELNLVYREITPSIEALLSVLNTSRGQAVISQAGFIAAGGR